MLLLLMMLMMLMMMMMMMTTDDHDSNTGMIQVDMPCLAALGNKFMTGDSGRAPPFFGGKWTDEMINEAKICQNIK